MKTINPTEHKLHVRLVMAKSFSDFQFDEWVPEELREQVSDFWGNFNRLPQDWLESWPDYFPHYGEEVWFWKEKVDFMLGRVSKYKPKNKYNVRKGKFFPLWNNQIAVVFDDGTYKRGSAFTDWNTTFKVDKKQYSLPTIQRGRQEGKE